MKDSEKILILLAVAGVGFAAYTAYQAYKISQKAQSPIQTIYDEVSTAVSNDVTAAENWVSNEATAVENWFSSLWGSKSTGGTPPASNTYNAT